MLLLVLSPDNNPGRLACLLYYKAKKDICSKICGIPCYSQLVRKEQQRHPRPHLHLNLHFNKTPRIFTPKLQFEKQCPEITKTLNAKARDKFKPSDIISCAFSFHTTPMIPLSRRNWPQLSFSYQLWLGCQPNLWIPLIISLWGAL